MRIRDFLSAILFSLLFSGWVNATGVFITRTYTTDDGLAGNFIECLFRDSRGFLWIGTRKGLQRFDGHEFRTYYRDAAVRHIAEDGNHQLVFSTVSGLVCKLSFRGNQSRVAVIDSSLHGKEHIQALAADTHGRVWVLSSETGLYSIGTSDHRKTLHLVYETPGARLYNCMALADGTVFLGGSGGTFTCYDITSGKAGSPGKTDTDIYGIAAGPQGSLWLSCQNALYSYTPGERQPEPVPLNRGQNASEMWMISEVIETEGHDHLYLNSNKGLMRCDVGTGILTPVLFSEKGRKERTLTATALLLQHPNIMWVGTEQGLLSCRPDDDGIIPFHLNDFTGENIPVKLRSIVETGADTLWAGSANNNGLYRVILNDDQPHVNRFYHPSSEPVNTINTIWEDPGGNLWIGTNGALAKFNTNTEQFTYYPPVSFVWDIAPGRDGRLWCATREQGITCFDPATQKARYYPLPDRQKAWQLEWFDSLLLVAGTGGFYYFDPVSLKYNEGCPALDRLLPQLKGRFWHMEWLDGRVLAFSSEDKGLVFADLEKGVADKYVYEGRSFYGFLNDGENRLWVITEGGIVLFNTSSLAFEAPWNEHRFKGSNLSFKGMFKRSNGDLLFAGDNGFNIISPRNMPLHHLQECMVLTAVEAGGVEYSDFVRDTSAIALEYGKNSITLRFADLALIHTIGQRYSYMLKGRDNTWQGPVQQNQVTYEDLSPGAYSFYAVSGNDKKAGAQPLARFYVHPPLWQRSSFIALFCLLGIVLITALFYYRHAVAKGKGAAERAVLETEIRALRSQVNPHFIFNALNAIQYFVLHNEKKDANNYLARFSSLIRKVLDYSALQTIRLEDEIRFLENYLEMEKMRFEERLEWTLRRGDGITGLEQVPTLLLQPLIENAVVHGTGKRHEGGHIHIHFSRDDTYVYCTIRDNGPGVQHGEKAHQSKGLKLLGERLGYLNRRYGTRAGFSIASTGVSGEYPGTEVRIMLPIIATAYEDYEYAHR